MSQKTNNFVTAVLTLVGSIGAAVIVSKREQRISRQNAKLREQLILARLLALSGLSFGIGCLIW